MKAKIPTIPADRLVALSSKASEWMKKTADESAAACRRDKGRKERLVAEKDSFQRNSVLSDERMFRDGGKPLSDQRANVPGFAENEHELRLRNAVRAALYKAREMSGMTQSEIGRKMGIPQPNVSRIELMRNATLKSVSSYLAACGYTAEISIRRIGASRTANTTR